MIKSKNFSPCVSPRKYLLTYEIAITLALNAINKNYYAFSRYKCLFKSTFLFHFPYFIFTIYYLNINVIFIKSLFFSPSAVVTLTDCYVAKRKNKPNALILHCIHEKISFPIAMCFCNARMCIDNEEETWYYTIFN